MALALRVYLFRAWYSYNYSFRQAVITSSFLDTEERCVDITLRVRAVPQRAPLQAIRPRLSDSIVVRKAKMDDLIEKHAEWHDYRLRVFPTTDYRIWKLHFTQLSRPDPRMGKPSWWKKLRQGTSEKLPNLMPQPHATSQSNNISCTTVDKEKLC